MVKLWRFANMYLTFNQKEIQIHHKLMAHHSEDVVSVTFRHSSSGGGCTDTQSD